MRQGLRLHPDSRCPAVTQIEVEAARPGPASLALRYVATGGMKKLRLPPATAPGRRDGLWRHTCFEAFLRAGPKAGYYEFNFAPSTHWAAYRFDGYRSGVSIAEEIGPPRVDVRSNGAGYDMRVSLELDRLSGEPVWTLGLAAVIEETSGRKSYWALAHPAGKPDFHHADCFVLELPLAERP